MNDARASAINGSFSLINKLEVKSSVKPVYNASNIQKIVFSKKLLDFSDDYARSCAKNQFWYLDSTNSTVLAENSGIQVRELLTRGGNLVETHIPLNRFSFFEELNDKVLPPMQLEIEMNLQDDAELIWQNDGTNRRVVVLTLDLWVPQLRFASEGQKMMNENFLRPSKLVYLREMLNSSTSTRDAIGTWQISSGIKNAKHVFVFIQQTRKENTLTQNPYIFDTFDIGGDNSAKLSTCCCCCCCCCRLQYGNSTYYPEIYFEETSKLRILNDLMNYRYGKND